MTEAFVSNYCKQDDGSPIPYTIILQKSLLSFHKSNILHCYMCIPIRQVARSFRYYRVSLWLLTSFHLPILPDSHYKPCSISSHWHSLSVTKKPPLLPEQQFNIFYKIQNFKIRTSTYWNLPFPCVSEILEISKKNLKLFQFTFSKSG